MIKIRVFAAFKDYFDEEFEIRNPGSIESLRAILKKQSPEASALIATARFAVNHEFIQEPYTIAEHENIFLIPPSGGG